MADPTELAMVALKRLGRYVDGKRGLVCHLPWQESAKLEVHSDTDWAGYVETRKSTSGGCLLLGRRLIKSWSSAPSKVAGDGTWLALVQDMDIRTTECGQAQPRGFWGEGGSESSDTYQHNSCGCRKKCWATNLISPRYQDRTILQIF